MTSSLPLRHAARAVIVDKDGKFAVLEINNGEYFKIPGGGMEEGESVEDTLRREAREEAGCEIEILEKIGEWEFPTSRVLNHSVCYLAKKVGDGDSPHFTSEEAEEGFALRWLSLEEALACFNSARPQTEVHANMNERDKKFLIGAQGLLKKPGT
jgi:8-oxo-dGTP pyrophosphatase MutT (NUDIX family)